MSVSEQKRKEDKEKAERLLEELANVSDMLQITVKRYGSTREMKHNSEQYVIRFDSDPIRVVSNSQSCFLRVEFYPRFLRRRFMKC